MATKTPKQSLTHLERTATEPRDDTLHTVTLTHISRINSTIRLFRLQPTKEEQGQKPLTFLPGQWLDVHVPLTPKAGGFTITSSPSLSYLELAVQKSPLNPPAAYLWRPTSEILGTELQVRIGGSFVWPPPLLYPPNNQGIRRVVFVAGGVGINPLMSIASFLAEQKMREGGLGFGVRFLYSAKDVGEMEEVLFLERLASVFQTLGDEGRFQLFLTSRQGQEEKGESEKKVLVAWKEIEVTRRRIAGTDFLDALGPVEERGGTVCYICGVPRMTDEFVEKARKAEGMVEGNILFEKWW